MCEKENAEVDVTIRFLAVAFPRGILFKRVDVDGNSLEKLTVRSLFFRVVIKVIRLFETFSG